MKRMPKTAYFKARPIETTSRRGSKKRLVDCLYQAGDITRKAGDDLSGLGNNLRMLAYEGGKQYVMKAETVELAETIDQVIADLMTIRDTLMAEA